MARPLKEGLDYFPLDVDMAEDKRVQFVVGKCGQEGFATIIHLLMAIYRNGYYLTWDELELYSTSQRINLSVNTISEVVSHLLNYGFFDKEKFDLFGILTSHGIQTRYLRACEYRKKVKMVKAFCLITPADNIKESRFEYINPPKSVLQVVNTTGEGIKQVENLDHYGIKQVESTQSKVKESKYTAATANPYNPLTGETDEEAELAEKDEATANAFTLFENNIHPITGQIETDTLTDLLDHYGEQWLTEAIKEAALCSGRSVKYIQSVLERWEREGFKAPKPERSKANDRGLQGTRRKNKREQGEVEHSESFKQLLADIEEVKKRPKPWEVQRPAGE